MGVRELARVVHSGFTSPKGLAPRGYSIPRVLLNLSPRAVLDFAMALEWFGADGNRAFGTQHARASASVATFHDALLKLPNRVVASQFAAFPNTSRVISARRPRH